MAVGILSSLTLGGIATWGGMKLWENFRKYNKEKSKESEEERKLRKQSALAFLGQDNDYLDDDAPDVQIPLSPVEVMGNMAGGLLPGSTVVPEIDSNQVIDATFSAIIQEIQRINNNIEAIRDAMLASSIIESNYRQEVIADLEQSIADKDKARSQRRSRRRRGNVSKRRPKPRSKVFGSVAESFKKMGIITTGFILTEFVAKIRDKGWGWLTGGNKNEGGEAGGIFTGPDSGYTATLHGTELVVPLNNKVTDGISGNEVTSRGSVVSNIFKNGGSSFALNNKSSIFSSSPASSNSVSNFNSQLSSIINSGRSTTIPVGDDEGNFTVIDMRTAKKLVNPNEGNASVTSGNEIITLSPERRMSPYEPFVTNHA